MAFVARLTPPPGGRVTVLRVVEPAHLPSLALLPGTVRAELANQAAALHAARIRAAQTLLADTERKITSIALKVGYATLQHFSTVFRRSTGETPSAWRARQRSVASS